MEVSKKQIIDGVIRFIDGVLIPQCKDKQTAFVLSMSKDMIKKGSYIDIFLDNPLISSVITEENGMYELGSFVDSMREILDDIDYPITLPSIPLLAPDETRLILTSQDFERLVSYIQPQPVA